MANKLDFRLPMYVGFPHDPVLLNWMGALGKDAKVQKAAAPNFSIPQNARLSKEEGDVPDLHDNLFNFIPGSCFEIGSSIALLKNPGQAGAVIDRSAQKLARVLEIVFTQEIGLETFFLGGAPKTLREWFKEKLVDRCSPGTDLGRCRDGSFDGWPWLQKQLNLSSQSPAYMIDNMLCKISVLCGFGELVKALAEAGAGQSLSLLLSLDEPELASRLGQIAKQIKHAGFDNKEARARTERPPVIDNLSVTSIAPPILPKDGKTYKIGFGEVYVGEDFHDGTNLHPCSFHDFQHEHLRRRYVALEKQFGRNFLPRQGQPIRDFHRPGMLSEDTFARMPKSFKKAGLRELLRDYSYEHGSGINRWFIKGTYARQSWEHDLPAAGSHSNTTVEAFIALNCLNKTSVFGDPEAALPAGLMVAAFMNFGGYHSFVETFPIAQAVAKNEAFQVQVDRKRKRNLYRQVVQAAQNYAADSIGPIRKFEQAYQAALPQRSNLFQRNISLQPNLSAKESRPATPSTPELDVQIDLPSPDSSLAASEWQKEPLKASPQKTIQVPSTPTALPSQHSLVYPPEIKANLKFLRANPSGFWIVKDGKLKVGNVFDRIASIQNNLFGPKKRAVQKPKDLIFDIYNFLAEQVKSGLSEGEKKQVRGHFFKILGKLSPEHFDRKWVSEQVEDFLIEGLPSDGFGKEDPESNKRIGRIQVALNLGILPKKNSKGKHGTLIFLNCQGKEEAIFKPAEWTDPSFLAKKGVSPRRQHEIVRESKKIPSSWADRAAFLLDRHFQFGLTPLTLEVRFKGTKGSLMLWEHGATSAKDFDKKKPSPKEIERFQKFAIYDYLLGNLDRHHENWLIKSKKNRLSKIVAIDNTHSFPYEHVTKKPLDHFLRRNHYAWGRQPIAKIPFTAETRRKMKEITTDEVRAFMNQAEDEFAGKERFFTRERMGLLFRRAAVLRTLADQADATPSLLASIFSEEETVKVLSGSNPSLSNS